LRVVSDGDRITQGGEKIFQNRVPGAEAQPHTIMQGAAISSRKTAAMDWPG
jgi:hypothetical protein